MATYDSNRPADSNRNRKLKLDKGGKNESL